MNWVLLVMGVVAFVTLAVMTWHVWVGPVFRSRRDLADRALALRHHTLAMRAMQALERERRVLIVAPEFSWVRLIQEAHLCKWIEARGETVRKPEYRYVRREQDLLGVDNCTILVSEHWRRGKSQVEKDHMEYRLKVLDDVFDNVDVQYIGEEYYSESR